MISDKTIREAFNDLKKTIQSQGYTIEVAEKLTKFDKILVEREKELQEKIQWINENTIGGMVSEAYSGGKRDAYEEVLGDAKK